MLKPDLLALACQLYGTTPESLVPLSGGHYNAVYQFSQGDHAAILRIGVEDCPPSQTLAMLEWVSYLANQGAPVTAPLTSTNGLLMESLEFEGSRYTLTAFNKVDGILAETIPVSAWTPSLYQFIGRAAGKFHRISAGYQPTGTGLTRPTWFESYEILEATQKLTGSADPARQQLQDLITELKQLPCSQEDFGMIHDDLHFANFLIQPDGNMVIIDFDDCQWGWFAIDIAMALFDSLVLYNPSSEEQAREFAQRFLTNYLAGYRQEFSISPYWLGQIPQFLKLKELCIYADLIDHPQASQPGNWVGDFMRGRSRRIAENLPYVELEFSRL
jgi:Ser/Thr protein kinase RdoA (MazF antagonist)